jgi:hypothetical protein
MKLKIYIFGVLQFSLLISGCSYMIDRGKDFTDIITISGEVESFNLALQFGPICQGFGMTGIGVGKGNGYGLRSGTFGSYEFNESHRWLLGEKAFYPEYERAVKRYDMEYDYITPIIYSFFGKESDQDIQFNGAWQATA